MGRFEGLRGLAPRAAGLALLLCLAAGCGAPQPTQGQKDSSKAATFGPSRGTSGTTKRTSFHQVWHVGNLTVSTQLLPKFYDPHVSFNFMALEPSAVYYVSKSKPTELVAQSLSNGQTHVIANVDCLAAWQGVPTEVGDAGGTGTYFLVQCGNLNGKLSGILVDAKTGHTWTLWTDGQGGADGTIDGGAVVSKGWVYFETTTTEWGPIDLQRAMDLATGGIEPLPVPLKGFDPYLAPDGTLYALSFAEKGTQVNQTPVAVYRVTGLKTTLVAHLPALPLGIGGDGSIWVSESGGTLTPNAGDMTIRVWNPGIHNTSAVRVIGTGPGYIISLGPTSSLGANGPVRVTVATAGGWKTITVGEGNDGDTVPVSIGPYLGAVFLGPQGRAQMLTVSGG